MHESRANWTHPDLQSLAGLFFDHIADLGEFTEIPVEDLPPPYRQLLGHTHHMTVTVENYHRSTVGVQVLDKRVTEHHYARKILLRRQSDNKVVQFGIVRLNRAALTGEVWQEINSEAIPLGRVLIEHNVMRNVKLMSTWRIRPGQVLRDAFSSDAEVCYGRTALIYTDGLPAVELLEIVLEP
jgi:chorismate-pyruvate lyase